MERTSIFGAIPIRGNVSTRVQAKPSPTARLKLMGVASIELSKRKLGYLEELYADYTDIDHLIAIRRDEIDHPWREQDTNTGGGREPKILNDQGRTKKILKPLSISPTLRSQSHGNKPKIVIPVLTPDRIVKRQNGRRFKENEDSMFTLNTQDRHGIYDGMSIRKLTPRETWRLQGFPDWAFDRAEKVNSNSQLYKQAGNSVTVPVIYEIAKRMNQED